MNTYLLDPIIDILREEGMNEDEVAQVLSEVITTASGLLYVKMMEELTDEEMQVIEDCPTDEEAKELILRLYSDKTRTTPEELMNVFLKEYVTTFLSEHIKSVKNPGRE